MLPALLIIALIATCPTAALLIAFLAEGLNGLRGAVRAMGA
jgi:hypothetical protein